MSGEKNCPDTPPAIDSHLNGSAAAPAVIWKAHSCPETRVHVKVGVTRLIQQIPQFQVIAAHSRENLFAGQRWRMKVVDTPQGLQPTDSQFSDAATATPP